MKKKILLMLLGVLLALPTFARDFEYTYEGQTITYTVIDEDAKTVMTKEGSGKSGPACSATGHLILPSHPKDGNVEYTLTKIGKYSFQYCSDLTSVVIPNTITELEFCAFNESGLTSVDLPNSLTTIGRSAFDRCKELRSINLPNSIKTIGQSAFAQCSGLTSLSIPESVEIINEYAFTYCTGLTSVTIPSTVKSVRESAFSYCGLKSIKIEAPILITSLLSSAFYYDDDHESHINQLTVEVPYEVFDEYKQYYYDGYSGSSTMKYMHIIPNELNFVYKEDNNMFDIGLDDSKTLSLSLQGAKIVNGFQTDITLTEGLSIASNSGKLDVTLGNGKAASHVVTAMKVAGPNTYRIVVYSSKNDVFSSEENLLNIGIQSDSSLRGGDIVLSNTICNLIYDSSIRPADVTITVPSFIGVESVTVTPATANLNLGKTLTLSAEVAPANAWNKTLSWSSSDTSIATVDANGVVTPKAKGNVTITATSTDGTNVSGSASITVTNFAQSLTFDSESITIEEDETLQLSPVFTPANAESLDLVWNSTDSNIAYVDDQNILHSLYPGEVVVTASNAASGLSATINVTVTPVLYGDANDDEVVAVDDLVTEVMYIVEQNPTPFSFKKADVNRDREVNIIDVTKTVNIVLSNTPSESSMRKVPGMNGTDINGMKHGKVTVDADGHAKFTINLAEISDVTALQGNINLTEGMTISNISLSDSQYGDHVVDFVQLSDTETRFVIYSLSLDSLTENAPVVEIEIDGYSQDYDQYAVVHDVYAADTESNLRKYNDMSIEVAPSIITGADSIESESATYPCDVYNMMGICVKHNASKADIEALAPGVYIINNQKIIR